MMAHDPKYAWQDGRVLHREGGYLLPADEPVMLLRGKDVAVPHMIRAYIALLEAQPQTQIVKDHIASATERLTTIEHWQVEHADRAGLGCHTCQQLERPQQLTGD